MKPGNPRRFLVLVLLVCGAPTGAWAEEGRKAYVMNDGETLIGVLINETSTGYLIRLDNGQMTRLPYADIRAVESLRSSRELDSSRDGQESNYQADSEDSRTSDGRRYWRSLTISPLHLVLDVLEISMEMNKVLPGGIVNNHTWVSTYGIGWGDLAYWEFGSSYRYYFVGDS